jgi:hypothetical protein
VFYLKNMKTLLLGISVGLLTVYLKVKLQEHPWNLFQFLLSLYADHKVFNWLVCCAVKSLFVFLVM